MELCISHLDLNVALTYAIPMKETLRQTKVTTNDAYFLVSNASSTKRMQFSCDATLFASYSTSHKVQRSILDIIWELPPFGARHRGLSNSSSNVCRHMFNQTKCQPDLYPK